MTCRCGGFVMFQTINGTTYTIVVISNKGNAGFPKGKRNQDESLCLAAFRELQEETGLKPNQFKVIPNVYFSEYNETRETIRYYVAECIDPEHVFSYNSKELLDVYWQDINDLRSKDTLSKSRRKVLFNAYDVYKLHTENKIIGTAILEKENLA
jgi:8-oxo-dGTP pyrophosphatase MutT (NUDIX family)